jgi:REP element-mobilizing transposase RayT
MARRYRQKATSEPVEFDRPIQRALVEELQAASEHQRFRLHAGSTEPTHVHALVSWRGYRPWVEVRKQIKSSLSRRLAREYETLEQSLDVDLALDGSDPPDSRDATRRESSDNEECRWVLKLSRGASRKRVRGRDHFTHLMTRYLVAHGGVKWFEGRGWVE